MDYAKRLDELGGLAMKTGCHNTLKALDIAREILRERDSLLKEDKCSKCGENITIDVDLCSDCLWDAGGIG